MAKSKMTNNQGSVVNPGQEAISLRLRQIYIEVVQEPIPADFLDLLHRLDQGTAKGP